MIRIGFLHSVIRKDEKLLLEAFQTLPDVEIIAIDDRELRFCLGNPNGHYDAVVERCINHSRALHALRISKVRASAA